MIIGVSGGDVYLGIKLLIDSLQALSSTRGSQKQYTDAVKQLETLEICLKVAQCKLPGLEADDSRSIVARAITECTNCIEGYQREILSKYEKFFGEECESNARPKFLRELKKIQWLHDKDKTETMSRAIASHVQIITLACSIGSLPPRTPTIISPAIPQPIALVTESPRDLESDIEAATRALNLHCKGQELEQDIIAQQPAMSTSDCSQATFHPVAAAPLAQISPGRRPQQLNLRFRSSPKPLQMLPP